MRFPQSRLPWMPIVQAAWILFQVMPGFAQGPSVSSRPIELRFGQDRFENVSEGYQSITWGPANDAAQNNVNAVLASIKRYELTDDRGRVLYSGAFNEAFVSGLPDGEHAFDVRGYSAGDEVLAASSAPVVVVVRHWSMAQAWWLFGIGATVFVLLIASIAWGWWRTRRIVFSRPATGDLV